MTPQGMSAMVSKIKLDEEQGAPEQGASQYPGSYPIMFSDHGARNNIMIIMHDHATKHSDVSGKDLLFMNFTNQQFWSQYNKSRNTFGLCTKKGTSLYCHENAMLPSRYYYLLPAVISYINKILQKVERQRRQ
jgi:hypothetical protein